MNKISETKIVFFTIYGEIFELIFEKSIILLVIEFFKKNFFIAFHSIEERIYFL